MRPQVLLIPFFLLISILSADTQTNIISDNSLSFNSCFSQACQKNPLLQKARASQDSSRDRLLQAWSAFLPTAGVSAGYTYLGQDPLDVSGILKQSGGNMQKFYSEVLGNPLLQYQYREMWNPAIRVNMPLFTGGRNLAGLKLAKDDLRLYMAQVRLQTIQLKIDTARAYYGVIINRMAKALTEKTIEQLGRRAIIVSNFVSAGSGTELELMRTRVLRSSWAVKYASTIRALELNVNRLSALTGIEKKNLNFTNTFIPISEVISESNEMVLARSLKNRPEMDIAQLSEDMGKAVKRIKFSGLLPQVAASWNTYWSPKKSSPSFSDSDWRNWWDIRLAASWEFVNLSRWADFAQAGHDKEARTFDMKAVRDKVKMDTEDAVLGLEEASHSYDASIKNLELAVMTADSARSRKKSGTITETDELESVLGEIEARVQKLRSQYDLIIALAEYRRATGLE